MHNCLIIASILLGFAGAAQAAGMAPSPVTGGMRQPVIVMSPPPPLTIIIPRPIVVPCVPSATGAC